MEMSILMCDVSFFIIGALTSVTNFATSVSRNMERLSLDSDHRERQEEWRRQKPKGLSDGLKQGLTVFGLSVLGSDNSPSCCLFMLISELEENTRNVLLIL